MTPAPTLGPTERLTPEMEEEIDRWLSGSIAGRPTTQDGWLTALLAEVHALRAERDAVRDELAIMIACMMVMETVGRTIEKLTTERGAAVAHASMSTAGANDLRAERERLYRERDALEQVASIAHRVDRRGWGTGEAIALHGALSALPETVRARLTGDA